MMLKNAPSLTVVRVALKDKVLKEHSMLIDEQDLLKVQEFSNFSE